MKPSTPHLSNRMNTLTGMTPILFCLVLLFSGLQQLPAQNSEPDVVIAGTWGLGPVFKPVLEINTDEDMDRLKSTLSLIEEEFEDPILIQLGSTLTPHLITESAFNTRIPNFYLDQNYDVLHYDTSDYVHNISTPYGFKKRSDRVEKINMTALDIESRLQPDLPRFQSVSSGDQEIIFASLATADLVTGVAEFSASAIAQDPQSVQDHFEKSESINLLMMEFQAGELAANLTRVPEADVVVDLNPTGVPVVFDGVNVVQRPDAHQVMILKGFDEDGSWRWESEYRDWTTPERIEFLWKPELPMIGVSVPGKGRLAELLGQDPDNITVEVFRDHNHVDLTPRKAVYVYQSQSENQVDRIYRVYDETQLFWIYLDGLVILNPDGTIRDFFFHRTNFPFHSRPTGVWNVLQRLRGKSLETWPENMRVFAGNDINGIERQALGIFEDIRRVLELDQRLYAD